MDSWTLIDTKSVKDSDGFWTDYTLWYNEDEDLWVCVFGDRDLYTPEDGYYDAEFDSEEEAREWFDDYEGFDDDDIEMSTSIESDEGPMIYL